MNTDDKKIMELAKYLHIHPEKIALLCDSFEATNENGETHRYLVLTDEEADERCFEEIKSRGRSHFLANDGEEIKTENYYIYREI